MCSIPFINQNKDVKYIITNGASWWFRRWRDNRGQSRKTLHASYINTTNLPKLGACNLGEKNLVIPDLLQYLLCHLSDAVNTKSIRMIYIKDIKLRMSFLLLDLKLVIFTVLEVIHQYIAIMVHVFYHLYGRK